MLKRSLAEIYPELAAQVLMKAVRDQEELK